MDASSGWRSKLMDPLTSMVPDVVIDVSICLRNELKVSLAVILKQDIDKSLTPGGRDGSLFRVADRAGDSHTGIRVF